MLTMTTVQLPLFLLQVWLEPGVVFTIAIERAPGANDDGSGTSALLQIAKIISTNKVRFLRTIHIVAFSGEEQGTYPIQISSKTSFDYHQTRLCSLCQ